MIRWLLIPTVPASDGRNGGRPREESCTSTISHAQYRGTGLTGDHSSYRLYAPCVQLVDLHVDVSPKMGTLVLCDEMTPFKISNLWL